jgi:multidrug efflux pump subunit AcrA (membrane-fusion protein)
MLTELDRRLGQIERMLAGVAGEENARLRAAKAAVQSAELDLEFTKVTAPVTGYVTNLNLRLGDQAVENQPALALVDITSYWIDGFFRETVIENMRGRPCDRYLDELSGQAAGGPGRQPRLGHRPGGRQHRLRTAPDRQPDLRMDPPRATQPVRIHLVDVPDGVALRIGTTASGLVMTGTSEGDDGNVVPPVPRALH